MSKEISTKYSTMFEDDIDVETDTASSIIYLAQEVACEEKISLLLSSETTVHTISFPPILHAHSSTKITVNEARGYLPFQCARNRKISDSGSDSGKEESAPIRLTEAQVVSGQPNTDTALIIETESQSHDETTQRNELMRVDADNLEHTDAVAASGNKRDKKVKSIFSENMDTGMLGVNDYDFNLSTFVGNGWPHNKPSAETMARAHFIHKGGIYAITVNGTTIHVKDMVECIRCGETMHSFEPGDDPIQEHHKLLTSMNKTCPKPSR